MPGQAKKPRAQICFEHSNQKRNFRNGFIKDDWEQLARAQNNGKIIREGKIARPKLEKKDSRTTGAQPQREPQKVSYNKASYCEDADTWLPAAAGEGAGTTNIACVSLHPGAKSQPISATDCTPTKEKGSPDRAAYYVIYDEHSRKWIELKTRSTWGVYTFLGTLTNSLFVENKQPIKLNPDWGRSDRDRTLLSIKKDYQGDCFVEVADNGHRYCVPDDQQSTYTKQIFTIIRQLMGLQTAIVNVPVSSSSVRITP